MDQTSRLKMAMKSLVYDGKEHVEEGWQLVYQLGAEGPNSGLQLPVSRIRPARLSAWEKV